MDEKTLIKILEVVKNEKLSEKDASIKVLGVEVKLYYYKKKFNLLEYKVGKNPNSAKKREFEVNDTFFHIPNKLNSYYAGFIAADGNIRKDTENVLTISLASKDKEALTTFIDYLQSNYNVKDGIFNSRYPYSYLSITSIDICQDLRYNFNITPQKSFTLVPPNLDDKDLIDSYIVGLIDGDGCIGITGSRFYISLMGTLEIITWVKYRFEEILGKDISNPFHISDKNSYTLRISDKNARILYNYYNNIDVPKLRRKWKFGTLEEHKSRKRDETKYKLILQYSLQGMNNLQIANELNITSAAIYWYKKQELYRFLEKETKALDKGEIDIETES